MNEIIRQLVAGGIPRALAPHVALGLYTSGAIAAALGVAVLIAVAWPHRKEIQCSNG